MFQSEIATQTLTPAASANLGWSPTALSSFLLTHEQTRGKAALLEAIQTRGNEPAPHIHHDSDETFYIIEGKMTFYVDGKTIAAPAGTSVFIGRGQEHSFTVDTATANTLILVTPA